MFCEFFEASYQLSRRWQQHPDHRHCDHLGVSPNFMVLRAATCDSPLISSWKNFPWSKSLFSFIQKILERQLLSTKPGGSTYRAYEPVGPQSREEAYLVSKITKFSSLPLPLSFYHVSPTWGSHLPPLSQIEQQEKQPDPTV